MINLNYEFELNNWNKSLNVIVYYYMPIIRLNDEFIFPRNRRPFSESDVLNAKTIRMQTMDLDKSDDYQIRKTDY